jgi:exonuclease SbcC
MRPLELRLTGLRSYDATVTVDFTGKRLAAVLGDTGSGKSSLLDAITFALFRKSSWDGRETRLLIADGAQAMSVEFTFLHEHHRWHVHRTLHATNPNAGRHHLINLDTGQEFDGAGAVDARIRSVLQMSYDTFLRVGLLPQGKFDQLLTATPKERAARLRELFGTDSLESIREMAIHHNDSLSGLIADATAARARMHDNPTQAAATAGAMAEQAEADAERLKTAIGAITALQKDVAAARDGVHAATTAAQALAARTVADATTVLDNLEPVVADIAARQAALEGRSLTAEQLETELTGKISQIEARGEGPDALAKAAQTLDTLPARAEELRDERDRLATRDKQLGAEGDAIAAAEKDLAERVARTQPLQDAADAATNGAKRLRTRAPKVRTLITAATTAAQRVAEVERTHSAAVGKLDIGRRELKQLTTEATRAAKRVTAAETRVDSLNLLDRAAGVAAELQRGDDCPVCHRHLPEDFEPASPTSAAELRDAKNQLCEAKTFYSEVTGKLSDARATVGLAEATLSEHSDQQRTVQADVRRAADAAAQGLADIATFAAETGGAFDADTASATLLAITASLAVPGDEHSLDPEQLTEPITSAIASCEQAAGDRAAQVRADLLSQSSTIKTEQKLLAKRTTSHQNAMEEAKSATARHARAVARANVEVRALPDRVRSLLAPTAMDVNADGVAVAASMVTAQRAEVDQLVEARDAARTDKSAVLAAQRALDKETRSRVDRPLAKLRAALEAWADSASQALAGLGDTGQLAIPDAPTESGIAEIRVFATRLSQTVAALHEQLTEVSDASSARADAATVRLREHAQALTAIDGFDPAADLTRPELLHPLVAAATTAVTLAANQRTAEHTAQAQIAPAADLEFAIAAGQARRQALDVLRREFVDAKFLGHLAELNTRTLLVIASKRLGELTDQRFGFAETFEIASTGSGATYNPNRLSGGEKFLASLALALALAELHSHSGPRLGSLFLDEGFAALDTNALESALEVLRSQTSADRLVLVVSHLHAVAEAVDDVLWVERGTTGSSARWLTPTQRDELVQADLASGLQSLA